MRDFSRQPVVLSDWRRASSALTALSTPGQVGSRYPFSGLTFRWGSLTAGQTVWIRFALRRGTLAGPTREIDITRISATELVSRNADPPRGGTTPDPCGEYGCNERPDPPEGEATYGNRSLTVHWTTENGIAGTDSRGNLARIRRMELKYEACPHRWDGSRSRFVRIGGGIDDDDTNCRTGTGTGTSTGTMTFRGSFGTIDGHQVDMWDAKMNAKGG